MENNHSEFKFANESIGNSTSIQKEYVNIYPTAKMHKNVKFQVFYSDSANTNRKTFAFWTIISILFFLTISNIFLTLAIVRVLRFGKGISGMELVHGEDLIKFYGVTDFESVFSRTFLGTHSFKNQPISIESSASNIKIRLYRNGQFMNRMVLDDAGISLRSINSFDLKDTATGATIFTTHRPQYNLHQGAENLITRTISASKIESPLKDKLNFEVDGGILLKGSEGVKLNSYGIFMQAENFIINSTQNSILQSTHMFLNVDKMPFTAPDFGLLRNGSASYKICICMPNGTLFRILIPRSYNGPKVTCGLINVNFDPCIAN